MSSVQQPLDLTPYLDTAILLAQSVAERVPLHTIIIDDWNTGEGIEGPRLIFAGKFTENCPEDCADCPLFQVVGLDEAKPEFQIRSSLCLATPGHIDLYPPQAGQRCLNCKTLEQYHEVFICWILEKCDTEELLLAELDWVLGFRILYYRGSWKRQHFQEVETSSQRFILEESIRRLRERGDPLGHIPIITRYGQEHGLL